MEKLIIPKNYKGNPNILETQKHIKILKDFFEKSLAKNLKLIRVSAPLFVRCNTGFNDNLTGNQHPVFFESNKEKYEIVQSLAKWKRLALKKYKINIYEGIYTDMNAIRPCENLDNTHSLYVDQWDWEISIKDSDRNYEFLLKIVKKIYKSFLETDEFLFDIIKGYKKKLPKEIFVVDSQELQSMYKDLTPKERERKIVKEKKAVFISKIGHNLSNREKHDGRSPDYDDWNLNGDIILYDEVLDDALELSSMGIRVNNDVLKLQLKESNLEERLDLKYHQMIIKNELPQSIGGGIGQSRICMYFLNKAHIGEVQTSMWSNETILTCKKNNIFLL